MPPICEAGWATTFAITDTKLWPSSNFINSRQYKPMK